MMTLSKAELNEKLVVAEVAMDDKSAFNKINSMGILPGTEVTLLQRKPTFVFQVYNSRFAIDDTLAGKIFVKRISCNVD